VRRSSSSFLHTIQACNHQLALSFPCDDLLFQDPEECKPLPSMNFKSIVPDKSIGAVLCGFVPPSLTMAIHIVPLLYLSCKRLS
jgi:hypothetical protein